MQKLIIPTEDYLRQARQMASGCELLLLDANAFFPHVFLSNAKVLPIDCLSQFLEQYQTPRDEAKRLIREIGRYHNNYFKCLEEMVYANPHTRTAEAVVRQCRNKVQEIFRLCRSQKKFIKKCQKSRTPEALTRDILLEGFYRNFASKSEAVLNLFETGRVYRPAAFQMRDFYSRINETFKSANTRKNICPGNFGEVKQHILATAVYFSILNHSVVDIFAIGKQTRLLLAEAWQDVNSITKYSGQVKIVIHNPFLDSEKQAFKITSYAIHEQAFAPRYSPQ